MSAGETRYGPSAPSACQRGWYATFTSSGWPTRLVVTTISSSPMVALASTPPGSGTSGGASHSSRSRTVKRGSSVKTRYAFESGLRVNQRYALSRHPLREERTGAQASGST